MKKIIQLLILLLSLTLSYGQKFNLTNSNPALEEKNGFKGIKLGSDVNNYPFIKAENNYDAYGLYINNKYYDFSVFDTSHVVDIKNNPEYQKIGNTKIYAIYISTYENKIFKIIVITEPNFDLYNDLVLIFGEPFSGKTGYNKKNYFMDDWFGKDIRLAILNQHNNSFYSIIYSKSSIEDLYDKKKEGDYKIKQEERKKKEEEEKKERLKNVNKNL